MRRTIQLVVLLFALFVLTSCNSIPKSRSNMTITVEFFDTHADKVVGEDVKVRFYEEEEVPYVGIETLLYMLGSYLNTELVQYSKSLDGFELNYYSDVLEKKLILEYNNSNKEINVNHFEFFNYLVTESDPLNPDQYYLTELESSVEHTLSNPIKIDSLDDYNISFHYTDGEWYIPLSVGNLLFRSHKDGLYFTGTAIFSSSSDYSFIDYVDEFYSEKEIPKDLMNHTMYYLAFYFDYFYGLNVESEPQYFLDLIINEYYSDFNGDTQDFYQMIDFMLYDFDDMHLYLYLEGFYGKYYDHVEYSLDGRRLQNFNSKEIMSEYCENNESRIIDNNTSIIVINSFDEYTPEIFAYETDLFIRELTDNVIIDLSCNGGGYVHALMDILPYLSDEIVIYKKINFEYGGYHQYKYYSTINKIDRNIYILTSPQTYSGGNLLAAYVKENEIGEIIGQKSSGGSSYISSIFAPAGMLIQTPDIYHISFGNNEYWEHGVTPDIIMEEINDEEIKDIFDGD